MQVLFWGVAAVSLGSAIAMLWSRNTVHSAMLLVLNFFTLAVFYVMQEADFLAAVQVIVYAGAIMVLFLFVIMLLGGDEEDLIERIKGQRTAAVALGIGLAGLIVFTMRSTLATAPSRGLAAANKGGNVEALGRVLFTKYLWPFEITSLLLIVAAVAAIVIGRRSEDEDGDEDEAPVFAEEPEPGSVGGPAGAGYDAEDAGSSPAPGFGSLSEDPS